ncbi:MAG: type II secretion system protein [Planctomycetota bacterium]|nr:type II secretion system protein [Planctomycetota bacterium]
MMSASSQRGFTLIEVMIALVLVVVIFGVAAGVVAQGQASLGGSSLQGEMQDRARLTLNRLAEELRSAGPTCPDWRVPLSGDTLCEYRKCDGYDPERAEVLWKPVAASPPKRIILIDDPDGRDKQLVIVDDSEGVEVALQGGVSAFSIVVDPDDTGNDRKVLLSITLKRKDIRVIESGEPTDRTITRELIIFLRN